MCCEDEPLTLQVGHTERYSVVLEARGAERSTAQYLREYQGPALFERAAAAT